MDSCCREITETGMTSLAVVATASFFFEEQAENTVIREISRQIFFIREGS
jgi:hypothetical protein